ncbi:MAG: C45 family peptidase [Chloroflexota bacterium]
MQVLNLDGDHFQMGWQHGQQVLHLRPHIMAAIEARLKGLSRYGGLDAPLLETLERKWRENAVSTLAMLRGIAAALALPFSQLFRYTAASYLEDSLQSRSQAEACSVWAASGPATRDGSPILVKNRDYHLEHLPLQVLTYATTQPGYRCLYVTSAGSPAVFSSGVNEAGLAVADTHVPSRDIGPGLARYTLMMDLLEQHAYVQSALSYLQKALCMGAGSLILADAQGNLAVVETGYHQCGLVMPEEHVVAATNHFVTPELREHFLDDRTGVRGEESRARCQEIQARLKKEWGMLDTEIARQVMAQHQAGSAAICRHHQNGEVGTISTAIFLPSERKLIFCNGRPCECDYATYTL